MDELERANTMYTNIPIRAPHMLHLYTAPGHGVTIPCKRWYRSRQILLVVPEDLLRGSAHKHFLLWPQVARQPLERERSLVQEWHGQASAVRPSSCRQIGGLVSVAASRRISLERREADSRGKRYSTPPITNSVFFTFRATPFSSAHLRDPS